jgi:hypothetical protein
VEIKLHAFSNSALDGRKWPASCINYFTWGKSPHYPYKRMLGRALSFEEDKTLSPAQNQTTVPPSSTLEC